MLLAAVAALSSALQAGTPPLEAAALVRAHFSFVWRSLRRLGLSEADADDATQQVFLVAARRIGAIEPGKEKSFLFGVALRTAQKARRSYARRREAPDDELAYRRDSTPGPDELLDRQRARALLDHLLDELGEELRVVFISYELEQMTMAEIAQALGIPPGTVASRLRRARAAFTARVAELEGAPAPGVTP